MVYKFFLTKLSECHTIPFLVFAAEFLSQSISKVREMIEWIGWQVKLSDKLFNSWIELGLKVIKPAV